MSSRARSDTVAEILKAARQRLLRSGIGNTRVEDIIAEAQVARSTFYRHFDGMDDLVARLAMDEALDVMLRISAEAESEGAGIAVRLARVLATAPQRYNAPPITRLIDIEGQSLRLTNLVIARPELMQGMAAPYIPIIEQGQRENLIRKDCTAAELAEWLARNMAALILIPPHGVADPHALEDYILRFIIPGILATAADSAGAVQRLDQMAAAIGRIETMLKPGG